MASITQERITAEEYAKLPETNLPMELINGEIIRMPAPKDKHQKLSGRFYQLLLKLTSGGEIRYSPTDVNLDEYNTVQPDLFWVSGPESRCTLGEDGIWHGAPDLVIEILSPGTAARDRREKFQLYEKYEVREYWQADPEGEYLEVWVLKSGKFEYQGLYTAEDGFESVVLGTQVELKAVFGDPAESLE